MTIFFPQNYDVSSGKPKKSNQAQSQYIITQCYKTKFNEYRELNQNPKDYIQLKKRPDRKSS